MEAKTTTSKKGPHTERGHWMPVVQISPDTKPTARKMPRRPRSE